MNKYPIKKGDTDLSKILDLINSGDLRNISDKIISCRCANCGEFAINTAEENNLNRRLKDE